MHSEWFKGFKNREERKEEVLRYSSAFDALRKLLEARRKPNSYEYGVDWQYKQIAVQEYNRALDDILKLIDLED